MVYQELKIIESSKKNKIKSSLSTEICSEAGLIPLHIDDSLVELGAMNPDFHMVREIVREIRAKALEDSKGEEIKHSVSIDANRFGSINLSLLSLTSVV